LITGFSSGIGRELAREFYRNNCRVFASARNVSKLSELKEEGIDVVQLDITKDDSIEKAVAEVIRKAGRIDILVNNAGVSSYAPAIEVPMQEIRDLMETNFFGLISLTQLVVKNHMIPARSGKIVQISSVAGEVTTPWNSIYGASKGAVTRYSDALRMELAPFGIKVITVKPGGVKSDIASNAGVKLVSVEGKSLYAAVWDYILKRQNTSQAHPMPTDEFAKVVVGKVLRSKPPSIIFSGTKATILRVVGSIAPAWLTDWIFERMFGLAKLKSILSKNNNNKLQ